MTDNDSTTTGINDLRHPRHKDSQTAPQPDIDTGPEQEQTAVEMAQAFIKEYNLDATAQCQLAVIMQRYRRADLVATPAPRAHCERHEKLARDMEETVDNVRDALGLESTHWLVIADQVRDVVQERDRLRARIAELEAAASPAPSGKVERGCPTCGADLTNCPECKTPYADGSGMCLPCYAFTGPSDLGLRRAAAAATTPSKSDEETTREVETICSFQEARKRLFAEGREFDLQTAIWHVDELLNIVATNREALIDRVKAKRDEWQVAVEFSKVNAEPFQGFVAAANEIIKSLREGTTNL